MVMRRCLRFLVVFALSLLAYGRAEAGEKVTFTGAQIWANPKAMTLKGVLNRPKGAGPFPAVVLLPNCGGFQRPEFIKYWPTYLNQLGYATLNVDSFGPRGKKRCSKKFKPSVKDMVQDAYGALAHLASLPDIDTERVAVLGSSLGASIVQVIVGLGKTTSEGNNFSRAVSLYASHCKKLKPGPGMIKTLVVVGDREKGIASCKGLPATPGLTVSILPKTYHGFDQLDATPLKGGKFRKDVAGNKRLYSKTATEKAKTLVNEFLEASLSAKSEEPPATTEKPKAAAPLPKVGNKDPQVAVSRRDADGDGKVSVSEWEKSPGLFSKIDADGDGFITPREFYDRWKSRQ